MFDFIKVNTFYRLLNSNLPAANDYLEKLNKKTCDRIISDSRFETNFKKFLRTKEMVALIIEAIKNSDDESFVKFLINLNTMYLPYYASSLLSHLKSRYVESSSDIVKDTIVHFLNKQSSYSSKFLSFFSNDEIVNSIRLQDYANINFPQYGANDWFCCYVKLFIRDDMPNETRLNMIEKLLGSVPTEYEIDEILFFGAVSGLCLKEDDNLSNIIFEFLSKDSIVNRFRCSHKNDKWYINSFICAVSFIDDEELISYLIKRYAENYDKKEYLKFFCHVLNYERFVDFNISVQLFRALFKNIHKTEYKNMPYKTLGESIFRCYGVMNETSFNELLNTVPRDLLFNEEVLTAVISKYYNFPTNELKNIIQSILEQNSFENLYMILVLANRIAYSNSSEIRFLAPQIIDELLKSSDPLKKFELVENVFSQNHLPYVGKIFRLFEILYMDERFNVQMKKSAVSPTLKKLPNKCKDLMFYDLTRAVMGSNNRSIRAYIKDLLLGDRIYKEIFQGNLKIDEISSDELTILKYYLKCLETMFYLTKEGKKYLSENNGHYALFGNIIEDITFFDKVFKGDKQLSLPDQIVRYFLRIKSADAALQMMDNVVNETNARNQSCSQELKLHNGDFVKGIGNFDNLTKLLQNGIVAHEFIGINADSDSTPFDTDLTYLTNVDTNRSVFDIITSCASSSYGPIYLLLKGDYDKSEEKKRFCFTRTQNSEAEKIDFKKYEVFYSGVLKDAYGLRTGFPSSEIDGFIVSEEDVNIEHMKLEITMNGFYIPIYDLNSGKLIFSFEEYKELSSKMIGLSYYGYDDYTYPSLDVLNFNGELNFILENIDNSNERVQNKQTVIYNMISDSLKSSGLSLKTYIDGDLSAGSVEILDSGSTGRGTNNLDINTDGKSSVDFDYIMRIDKIDFEDYDKRNRIIGNIASSFSEVERREFVNGNIRFKGVSLNGIDELVDIDITFIQKNDKMDYSTDMCLTDRLHTIHNKIDRDVQNGVISQEEGNKTYKSILANIIFAKEFLKKAGCYKNRRNHDNPEGGLGGIGIENWILQNGGSFLQACTNFLEVANRCSSFEEFTTKYCIWDFGKNHMSNRYPHDNFVSDNMDAAGFFRMKNILNDFVKRLKNGKYSSFQNISRDDKIVSIDVEVDKKGIQIF